MQLVEGERGAAHHFSSLHCVGLVVLTDANWNATMARQHSFLSFDLMELRSGEVAGPPQSLVDKIKTTAGYKAVFFGRQHEDAKVGVLCIGGAIDPWGQ